MRFGLALSGGGLRGAAHIGVIKALEEEGLYPSWISGTSAGSIIASLYACGYSPEEMETIALGLDPSIFDPDYSGILRGVVQLIFGKEIKTDGIIKGKNLELLFDKLTQGKNICDVKIPLAIPAVDINNGQTIFFINSRKSFSDDPYYKYIKDVKLADAIRASIAIPVVFQPKSIDGKRLVDGGVTENLPIRILKEMGASRVVGVYLGYSGQMRREVDNIIEIGGQTIDIMGYQITRMKSREADCILNPKIYDVGLRDLHRIKECIDRGYETAVHNMYLIKKVVNS